MAISIKSVTASANTSNPITVVTSESPTATQVGDLVVVIHCNDFFNLSNMPTPTATGTPTMTAITNGTADGGTDVAHVKSYTYVTNTGGAQTISVTETGPDGEDKGLIAYVLTGADISTPVDVAGNTISVGSEDPWVLAAISPSSSDAFLIAHVNRGGAGGTTGTMVVPGGMTERYNTGAITAPDIAGATEQLAASGSTGTRSFDAGTSTRPWAGVLIAIRTSTSTVKYAMLRPAVVTR